MYFGGCQIKQILARKIFLFINIINIINNLCAGKHMMDSMPYDEVGLKVLCYGRTFFSISIEP